jgi:hypothetical protein
MEEKEMMNCSLNVVGPSTINASTEGMNCSPNIVVPKTTKCWELVLYPQTRILNQPKLPVQRTNIRMLSA